MGQVCKFKENFFGDEKEKGSDYILPPFFLVWFNDVALSLVKILISSHSNGAQNFKPTVHIFVTPKN